MTQPNETQEDRQNLIDEAVAFVKERIIGPDYGGTTHWSNCWRSHPRCAVLFIIAERDRLAARITELEDALEPIVKSEGNFTAAWFDEWLHHTRNVLSTNPTEREP